MEQLLVVNHLTKSFGRNIALNDIFFQVMPGRIVGLLGPNGSGKTTLIKIINSLIAPTSGQVLINGEAPGVNSKKIISYLPDKPYFNDWMKVTELMDLYEDFYEDFDRNTALNLLGNLHINPSDKIKRLSKGTIEKVQLIMVMSRKAKLYILDEPIAGVDPAARDYILSTIISNYNRDASIIISTHLIADIENVLDDALFLREGNIAMYNSVENIRSTYNQSVDATFREVFRC